MDKACLEAGPRIRPDRGTLMVAQAPAGLNFLHDSKGAGATKQPENNEQWQIDETPGWSSDSTLTPLLAPGARALRFYG
jgi:hypothetical protein